MVADDSSGAFAGFAGPSGGGLRDSCVASAGGDSGVSVYETPRGATVAWVFVYVDCVDGLRADFRMRSP